MIVRNKTPKPQALTIYELSSNREFTIYVEGYGSTEIVGAYIPNQERLEKVFQIELGKPAVIIETLPSCEVPDESVEIIEEVTEDESEELHEEEEATIVEEKFICDVCGSEFASARGLTSHKNRAHNAE